ncbi:MAG: hypothetical protein RIT25_1529 [Planctomycetota bacterium]
MRFDPPLREGILVRRHKRFLADVQLADGTLLTAHCANSGSMLGVAVPGSPVALSHHPDKGRKLEWTWELVRLGSHWVGVNTALPNQLVADAIASGAIPTLAGWPTLRREVAYGTGSRIDLLLQGGGRPDCYVEVKNVTLAEGKVARFPDSVTTRGQKHLRELMAARAQGHRAALVFWVFRGDCNEVRPADDIDPEYGRLLRAAARAGVELVAVEARVSPQTVEPGRLLPVVA